MDGEFACPECGQIVKVRRFGSGRQVRCKFCKRLLEVPFLPRASNGWKRTSSAQPRWVVWAWVGVGFVAVALVSTAAMQLILSQERAARAHTINKLIAASEAHEQAGRFDMALLDLDTALEYLPSAVPAHANDRKTLRDRRRSLALRDVQSMILQLAERDASALGDWLNVQARVGADHDLGTLGNEVRAKFLAALHRWIDVEEAAARSAVVSQRPVDAVAHCTTAAGVAIHLPPDDKQAVLRRLSAIVVPLIERRGVVIDKPSGEFLLGTEAGYDKSMRPVMIKALGDKGYLPAAPTTPWRDDWARAPYRLTLSIHERQEGNYMATQNRLTRIEARISFSQQGREIWKSTPNARTTVPLPSLPNFISTRLALSDARLPEVEKMLYENAQAMIGDKFKAALAAIPDCPRPIPPAVAGGR
ncbi:MAG: hypothetical protein P4L85_00475 [Paludisphaera borealis]|uniref:hypothetical protein n=1 Tax=Paludisphaera borealis TaxID=1387353 RepID=UPI0028450284|nr:hypothetical protein [Paludisphaera borealis]MDR3617800.1 hypothetical protein [Paludisphaera borealis]